MRVEPKSKQVYWHHEMSIKKMLGADFDEFNDMYDYTDRIPGSFTRLNAAVLFQYSREVSGLVVEIGVDQGRSASILLHNAQKNGSWVVLVDSWSGILVDNMYKAVDMTANFPNAKCRVVRELSVDAAEGMKKNWSEIDLLHIDAHHYKGGVDVDCQVWLPLVRPGGLALFHDYASTFDAVTESVDKYTERWEDLGAWDSLAVRRKP